MLGNATAAAAAIKMPFLTHLYVCTSVHECMSVSTPHTHTHTKAKAKFLAALTRSRYLANPGCLFTKQAQ